MWGTNRTVGGRGAEMRATPSGPLSLLLIKVGSSYPPQQVPLSVRGGRREGRRGLRLELGWSEKGKGDRDW